MASDNGPRGAAAEGAAVGREHAEAVLRHLRNVGPTGAARSDPARAAGDLGAVIGLLPSPAHQALVRLVLVAVVARSKRAADGVTGWPSFCRLPVPRDHPVASNMGPSRVHIGRLGR